MLLVEEALHIVLDNTRTLTAERVAFTDALGRVLREDVPSDVDMPPFARSAVDGFALVAEDLATLPKRLEVVTTIPAGAYPDITLERGQAAQIMTGAPVPAGADAVQMVEKTRTVDAPTRTVEILEAVSAGTNIARRGSEVRRGDTVLRAGTRIDPAAIAVAASVGKVELSVGKRPRVAVLATGDELVPPSTVPAPGQIRNSNGFSLAAQCRSVGIEPSGLGVAQDTEASLRERIEKGLSSEHDVLLLSGGVSMGVFDLVESVLTKLGARVLVESVALKPGKPLVFALSEDGKLIFGLPGNPVSTMVTFELFVRTAIARMEGVSKPTRDLVAARLLSPLGSRGPRRAYLPGWLSTNDRGELEALPISTRGSGDIVAFAKANALLIVPEDRDRLSSGETVMTHPLDSYRNKDNLW
jgi:molybdopterin molybdotransferase